MEYLQQNINGFGLKERRQKEKMIIRLSSLTKEDSLQVNMQD